MILQGHIYLDLRALHIQQICEKSCEIFYQVKNLAFKQGGNCFFCRARFDPCLLLLCVVLNITCSCVTNGQNIIVHKCTQAVSQCTQTLAHSR